MAAPNVQRIIWEYITATGTSLYSLIGARAWHSAYPVRGNSAGQWPANTAGIVFTIAATETPTNAQTDGVTVEFRCHGGDNTFSGAQAVARALFDRLQASGGSTTSGYIHRAFRRGQQDLTDPDTGWPFTLARYSIIIED